MAAAHSIYCLECSNGYFYVGRCLAGREDARFQEHLRGAGATFTALHRPRRFVYARPSSDPLEEDLAVLQCMREHGILRVRGGSWSAVDLSPEMLDNLVRQLNHAAGNCLRCGQPGHYAAHCRAPTSGRATRQPQQEHNYNYPQTQMLSQTHRSSGGTGRRAPPPQAGRRRRAPPGTCERCGREGHVCQQCYAKTDVEGHELDSGYSESDEEEPPAARRRVVKTTSRERARSPVSSRGARGSGRAAGNACRRCGREGHFASQCYARTHASGYTLQ